MRLAVRSKLLQDDEEDERWADTKLRVRLEQELRRAEAIFEELLDDLVEEEEEDR